MLVELSAARVTLGVLVIALTFTFARAASPHNPRATPGALVYYAVSHLFIEHALGRSYTDPAWFVSQMNRFQSGLADVNYNPPTTGLLTLPISGFKYQTARIIFVLANVGCGIGALLWLLLHLRLPRWWPVLLLPLLLFYEPLRANITLGMPYAICLVALVGAWVAYRRGHDILLGVVLGFLLMLKLIGPLLWILIAVQGRARAVAAAVGTAMLIGICSLPWAGWSDWQAYFHLTRVVAADHMRAITAYQSVTGFFMHLFTFDAVVNPVPLANWPHVSTILTIAAMAILLGVSIRAARHAPPESDAMFGAFVIVGSSCLHSRLTITTPCCCCP